MPSSGEMCTAELQGSVAACGRTVPSAVRHLQGYLEVPYCMLRYGRRAGAVRCAAVCCCRDGSMSRAEPLWFATIYAPAGRTRYRADTRQPPLSGADLRCCRVEWRLAVRVWTRRKCDATAGQ